MKYVLLTLSLFLLLGCIFGNTLSFDLAGEPVDGMVYQNGNYLGTTQNGKLSTQNLSLGELVFEGVHQGRDFSFTFQITSIRPSTQLSLPEEYFSQYELSFEVAESNVPLDGDVFLNNQLLGSTTNGSLSVGTEEIYPGLLTLQGEYEGTAFEFFFSVPRDFLDTNGLRFQVEKERLNNLLFDAANLNVRNAELLILEKINENRLTLGGGELLEWNSEIASVARAYAKKLQTSGFHHVDEEGNGVGERLQQAEIFYTIAGENLYFSGNLPSQTSEEDLAKLALEGWLKSPGHRSLVLDRDNLYTDAGVGVHCKEKECYVVLNLAGMGKEIEIELQENSCWYFNLYDDAYPYNYDTTMQFTIDASQSIDVYLVDERDQIDNCIERKSIDAIKTYSGKSIKDTKEISKGMGLLFETTKKTEVELEIVYG